MHVPARNAKSLLLCKALTGEGESELVTEKKEESGREKEIEIQLLLRLPDQISRFLHFVKTIYADLPKTMATLLEPNGDSGASDDSGKATSVSSIPPWSLSLLFILYFFCVN